MATQLWFLRHGEAEPHDARPDHERRLTARGEEQSRAAGRALSALELTFQLAVTSPRVRASDTLRLACESLHCEPVLHEPLSSGFDADDAIELAHAAGADKRVLIVGHNPDFDQVVCDLTGARAHVRKGGVAAVRLDGRRGTLLVLMRPREIARVGGS
jgi:phosphohistidine phosphatase